MIKLILKLFTNSRDMTRSERGATYVYVAILLPAFIGFIGLGVDIGLWQVTKRDTQIIADASAVAGALEVMRFQTDPDEANTNQAALAAAIANGYDAGSGLDGIEINDPPVSGPYVGADGKVEVIMTREAPIFFSSLFRTAPVFVRSRAVAASGTGGNACIWALSPDDPSSLKVAGTAEVDIDCGVRVNSSDDDALNVVGGGCIFATEVMVSGDVSGDCINPLADTTDFIPYDPLEGIDEPLYDGDDCDPNNYNVVDEMVWIPSVDEFDVPILDEFGDPILVEVLNPVLDLDEDGILDKPFTPEADPEHATRVFGPGCFSKKVTISTSDLVTFNPGLYIFDGASFTLNGGSNVVGTGVMFFLNPNKTNEQVDILAGAKVSLSAPTSASCATLAAANEWSECLIYESILFFESDVDFKLQHKFGGGASMDLNGIMYFPESEVLFQGGGETDNTSISIIAYTIDFVGTTNIGGFPTELVVGGEEGEVDITLPFNRFLVKVQLLE